MYTHTYIPTVVFKKTEVDLWTPELTIQLTCEENYSLSLSFYVVSLNLTLLLRSQLSNKFCIMIPKPCAISGSHITHISQLG